MQKLLNVEQAADALAIREKTVRAWIAQRRLGYVRVAGRAIRIPQAEIDRLLSEGSVPALEPRQ